ALTAIADRKRGLAPFFTTETRDERRRPDELRWVLSGYHCSDDIDQTTGIIGLAKEGNAAGKVGCAGSDPSRRHNQLYGRPFGPNVRGETVTIHCTWHIHIGADQ